jgi:crossover junction endodeoxyribonuclease RuvC
MRPGNLQGTQVPSKALVKTGSRLGKVVLGIDPGLARMGYGVIVQQGNQLKALDYDTLTTEAQTPVEIRLAVLFKKIQAVLRRAKPDQVAMEELFFSRNVKTAIAVGQARGVALLACGLEGIPVFEYKPVEVKQAVAGFGGADKQQIQKMVKLLLGLTEVPRPDDTADALAVAITHTQCSGTRLSEAVKRLSREKNGQQLWK